MAAGVLQYALSLSTKAFTGPMKTATGLIGGMGSAAAKTTGLVLKLGTGLGALAGGVSILSALSKAANMESLNVSMEVLIGNAEEATKVMAELRQFAGATPFNTREVMEAGKNLIALGSSTETLTAELRALGDVSAGMQIPLKDMVDIYGKARTQGTLFAEDLNQLAGRGVPIFKELARVLGVSENQIKKMASEGQITFPMLQKVFSDLTSEGGKFFGMMEKQSGTTQGLLSTLKSELDNLLIAIGTPINDFLKPIITSNIGRMQALNERVVAFLTLLSKARDQGQLGEFLGAGLKLALIEGINLFSGGVRGTIAYLAAAIPPIFNAAIEILTSDRTKLFFQSLFQGLALTLEAGILRGVAKLPGMEDYNKVADAAAAGAGVNFKLAANALAGADFEGAIDKMGKAITEGGKAGAAAMQNATKNPLIDPSQARQEFQNVASGLDPEALKRLIEPPVQAVVKQVETLEQAVGGLDTSIKKATPEPAKPEPKNVLGNGILSRASESISTLLDDAAKRRSLLSANDTTRMRLARGERVNQADLLQLRSGDRARPLSGRLISPRLAAERLARANAAADQRPGRGGAAVDPEQKRFDALTRVVQSISDKFDTLVTA